MKSYIIAFLLLISMVSYGQIPFKPFAEKDIKSYLKEAKKAKEIDTKSAKRIFEILDEMGNSSTDANEVYNYGRAIAKALQPGFQIPEHSFTNGAIQLMVQAEVAYRYAITNCECHGRANIMLGMLYNQEKKYFLSEPYLEKGLKLEEASEDWMIAANQYLLAGAYTNKTKEDKYQVVYEKFKKYAPQNTNPYYQKMASMYVPYYED